MVKSNSFKAWFLASRPKTLTGAIAPVLLGGALAWKDTVGITLKRSADHYVQFGDSLVYLGAHYLVFFLPFAFCLLFAMLMQVDANFVNDWWDYRKGTDREDRLGPERACAQGWITEHAMVIGIAITTVLACCVGSFLLLWHLQWELLLVGLGCVLGCFLYTLKLSYLGFGDLLVLVFFGIVPVGFTYYVITGGLWTLDVTLLGIGMGLITDCLLMVNNYRDVEQDRISGKHTLIVRFGKPFGVISYLVLSLSAIALLFYVAIDNKNYDCTFAFVLTIIALRNVLNMTRLKGKALNALLGKTALMIFLYGLLGALALTL